MKRLLETKSYLVNQKLVGLDVWGSIFILGLHLFLLDQELILIIFLGVSIVLVLILLLFFLLVIWGKLTFTCGRLHVVKQMVVEHTSFFLVEKTIWRHHLAKSLIEVLQTVTLPAVVPSLVFLVTYLVFDVLQQFKACIGFWIAFFLVAYKSIVANVCWMSGHCVVVLMEPCTIWIGQTVSWYPCVKSSRALLALTCNLINLLLLTPPRFDEPLVLQVWLIFAWTIALVL
jgi:hypothetical protein